MSVLHFDSVHCWISEEYNWEVSVRVVLLNGTLKKFWRKQGDLECVSLNTVV